MERLGSKNPRAQASGYQRGSCTYEDVGNVCIIGAGYVGGTLGAVIACWNPRINVFVTDRDNERLDAWLEDDLPIHELGLLDIVKHARNGDRNREPNLFFVGDINYAISESEMIFICVDTPSKEWVPVPEGSPLAETFKDKAGAALDLSRVMDAIHSIVDNSVFDKIIVLKSTVPIGTVDGIKVRLKKEKEESGVNYELLANPEFLTQGTAVFDILWPARVVIGYEETNTGFRAAQKLDLVYSSWRDPRRIEFTTSSTAEMVALASNVLVAQRMSTVNALGSICELRGCEIEEVVRLCSLDPRVGTLPSASLGFGGPSVTKDVKGLVHMAEESDLAEVAGYFRGTLDINRHQQKRCARRVAFRVRSVGTNKIVAVFGFSFKKDTKDMTGTPALTLAKTLLSKNVMPKETQVRFWDPLIDGNEIRAYMAREGCDPQDNAAFPDDPYEACKDAEILVIATNAIQFGTGAAVWENELRANWEATRNFRRNKPRTLDMRALLRGAGLSPAPLDWQRVSDVMTKPKLVVDLASVVDKHNLHRMGFHVENVGGPSRLHISLNVEDKDKDKDKKGKKAMALPIRQKQ